MNGGKGNDSGWIVSLFGRCGHPAMNFSQVERIKLLINGSEMDTFNGHLNLKSFFSFKESLVKRQSVTSDL